MISPVTPSRAPRQLALALCFVAFALVAPATASAAVTCNFNAGTLNVDITSGSTVAAVERGAGAASNEIKVYDGFLQNPVACAGLTPTVTNTDLIDIDETVASQASVFYLSLAQGAFAPGLTDEAGGSDEIEFDITAVDGQGETDLLSLKGSDNDDNIRLGETAPGVTGVNLNGAELDGLDADVSAAANIDRFFVETFGGNDTITGDGTGVPGAGVGPVPVGMIAAGGAGEDTMRAGSGSNNTIDGGLDDDELTGGANGDTLGVGDGDDIADGGGSSDIASYLNHTDAVTVDLRLGSPQNTVGAGTDTLTNVEGVVGSDGSDNLTGTDGPNLLSGGQLSNDLGDDVLSGLGGSDSLYGGPGDDLMIGGAGDDAMTGMAGTDTVSYATGSTAAVTLTLDPAFTGMAQTTGGAGSDTLTDDIVVAGTHHGVENIVGTPFDDTFVGNDSANDVDGGAGEDTIWLAGENDTFHAHDAVKDTIDCGPGADAGTADEQGVDDLVACETPDFAPQTAIAGGPADGATTSDRTPTYALTADEAATFQVRVDGGGFQACASSCTPSALPDGTHTLAFRAVDSDEGQNPDLNPATRTITVDATGPSVALGTRPPDSSTSRLPRFTFTTAEASAQFQCRFDAAAFAPCKDASGPTGEHVPTSALGLGNHTFQVRAVDTLGNAGPAVTDSFVIRAVAVVRRPTIAVRKKAKVSRKTRRARIATITCGSKACSIARRSARLKLGKKRFKVKLRSAGSLAPGAKGKVTVVLSKRVYRKLRRARKGTLTGKLTITAGGVARPFTLKLRLTR